MSSVLSLNLKDRQEVKALAKDEYELQIMSAEAVDLPEGPEDQSKKARISIRCEVIGEPTADDVWHSIFYPNNADTEKQRNRKLNSIANFMEHLGLDPDVNEIDLEDWVGKKFTAILDVDEYEGQERNIVKKLTAGQ